MRRRKILIIIMIMYLSKLIRSFENETSDYISMVFYPSGCNFAWPSEFVKKEVMEEGIYTPRDILPTRMQFYDNSVFFVFPKLRSGVPFSLGKMCMNDKDKGEPKIYPYPSWEAHDFNKCDPIQNIVDIFIDSNNMIWGLDIGIINTLQKPKTVGIPRVIGIDPTYSKVKYVINLSNFVSKQSRLQFLVVEALDTNSIIYISDAGTRSIIAYDVVNAKGHRIILPKTIHNDTKKKDILYLVLTEKTCGDPLLIFTYLGSETIYGAKTKRFREGRTHGSILTLGRKPGKIVILGTDNGMNIFFRFQGENKIYLWNISTTFKLSNMIEIEEGSCCRTPTHITVGYKRLMWVLETNFQDYISQQTGCAGVTGRIHPLVKSSN